MLAGSTAVSDTKGMEQWQPRREAPGSSRGERFKKSFVDRDARFNAISIDQILAQIDLLCSEQIASWARGFVTGTPVQKLANESGVPRRQVEEGLKEAREVIIAAAKTTLDVSNASRTEEQSMSPAVEIVPPRYNEPQPQVNEQNDYQEDAWRAKASCASKDPETFFPSDSKPTNPAVKAAKKICGLCEVRGQCLTYALENNETFGIWGGLTEGERRNAKRSRSIRRR